MFESECQLRFNTFFRSASGSILFSLSLCSQERRKLGVCICSISFSDSGTGTGTGTLIHSNMFCIGIPGVILHWIQKSIVTETHSYVQQTFVCLLGVSSSQWPAWELNSFLYWVWILSITFPKEQTLVLKAVVAFQEFTSCLSQGKGVQLNLPWSSITPSSLNC